MGALNIGRIGVNATIDDPSAWSATGRRHRLTGWLTNTTLADRQSIARELVSMANENQLIALTYSADSTFDGFYKVNDVEVARVATMRPNSTSGAYQFVLELEWVGAHSSVEFRSALTGALKTNSHGVDSAEAVFWHAPPAVGTDAYRGGGGTTAITRTTEDGDIDVFLDVATTSDPRWSASPSNYYDGAARIDVNGYTRAGLDAPMTPESWVLGNGLIEVRGEASGGTSIGDIGVRAFNSTWGSWTAFDIVWSGSTDIPEWHYFTIVRNTPEVCIVRLVRDADEAPATDNLHTLDIQLRRGAPFAIFNYTYSSAVTLTIDRASTDAATSITPTGASSAMAARDSADDGDGNRWVVGGATVSAVDTTNGGIDLTSATSHDFFIGFEIGGSGAASDDLADPLCLQYLGRFAELVVPTRR